MSKNLGSLQPQHFPNMITGELILRDASKELYKIEPFEQSRTNLLTSAGIYVPVDVESLLDKIFVAPLSEDWYVNLVKSVVSKYGISQDKVVKSNLYSI
jgi:hypothetical protein